MSTPLVSIIIPCYNACDHIAEAIHSALNQTYSNCEVIVIDDGSTDNSLEVIKQFSDHIRWETGPNRGACAARNRGLELARGEWIQFLDADDLLDTNKIEAQIRLLSSSGNLLSIAACPWQHLNRHGRLPQRPKQYWRSYDCGADMLLDIWRHGGFLCIHSWLVSKLLCNSVGQWDTSLIADQDGDYFGRVLLAAERVLFSSNTSVDYRQTGVTSITGGAKSTFYLDSKIKSIENTIDRMQRTVGAEKASIPIASKLLSYARAVCQYDTRRAKQLVERAREIAPSVRFLPYWSLPMRRLGSIAGPWTAIRARAMASAIQERLRTTLTR